MRNRTIAFATLALLALPLAVHAGQVGVRGFVPQVGFVPEIGGPDRTQSGTIIRPRSGGAYGVTTWTREPGQQTRYDYQTCREDYDRIICN